MTYFNTRLLLGSSLVATMAAVSPGASAQTGPATGPLQPVAMSADPAPETDVVVTGSRIRLPNLDSLPPMVTIGRQNIEERNLTNVADVLNELPGFRGSVTPNGAQGSFGQGVNFVNGYGLGSNRTLVLVNGRRFVTSNVPTLFNQGSQGTQVDLNVINSLLTDRIYISLEKLAVWAENEQSTSRNLGLGKSWLRRELDLKASVTTLQRAVWQGTSPELKTAFLDGGVLRTPMERRYEALNKAGIQAPGVPRDFGAKAMVKRLAVRHVGAVHPSVANCLQRADLLQRPADH